MLFINANENKVQLSYNKYILFNLHYKVEIAGPEDPGLCVHRAPSLGPLRNGFWDVTYVNFKLPKKV